MTAVLTPWGDSVANCIQLQHWGENLCVSVLGLYTRHPKLPQSKESNPQKPPEHRDGTDQSFMPPEPSLRRLAVMQSILARRRENPDVHQR